jgi:hypothetical protein
MDNHGLVISRFEHLPLPLRDSSPKIPIIRPVVEVYRPLVLGLFSIVPTH